ncbi:MAG: exodeoxyribonuclease VII large subunit [Clostridiales bacterium]|nr:exodeoxyribonuclease VII large subunit [Clostridiales bacterium]
MNNQVLAVSQVNEYVKNLLDRDPILRKIWIKGEISNFKFHSSGHMYFTLKDNTARLRCVFFKFNNQRLLFAPEDGMEVIVEGNISLYSREGQYQLYVEDMKDSGAGRLHLAFEALKKKLDEEGLFNQEFKKPIPAYPNKIALITSHTGSTVHDMIKVITQRNPTVDILVIPVSVQGEFAKTQISSALYYANTRCDIDLIILGRGGGSIEELWAFNEEQVARAIFDSAIPVISAVGHETDFTIADLVADIRAATPSAAGEIAVSELSSILKLQRHLIHRLSNAVINYIQALDRRLYYLSNSYGLKYPERLLAPYSQRLDYCAEEITTRINNSLRVMTEKLLGHISFLEALNPLSTIKRGFSIVTDIKSEQIICSINQIYIDMPVSIRLSDGRASCIITGKKSELGDSHGE